MAKNGDAKTKILEAADDLFATRGVAAVSARDVAAAAGVAKAAVFYYFDGMEPLYEAVLARYYHAHQQALFHAVDGEGGVDQRVHRLIDAYLDFMAENTRYARMIQRQLADGTQIEPVQANFTVLMRGIERALADVTPADGPLAARHFFVTLGGAVINTFTYAPALEAAWGSDPRSSAAIAERRAHLHWLVDAILKGLRAEAPAVTVEEGTAGADDYCGAGAGVGT